MSNQVILLTGCVNPNGMPLTSLTDTAIRSEQYIYAIHYYLAKTKLPIVFCENSNTKLDICNHKRLEYLYFDGNKDKTHGKGYGECEIIEYALTHSKFLANSTRIIKITGRLIVQNITSILKINRFFTNKIQCIFHSDLSFADSRIICCNYSFLEKLINQKERIYDEKGIYLEHILADCIKSQYKTFIPYFVEPQITGISGSLGITYTYNKKTIKQHCLYLRYCLYIWYHIHKYYNFQSTR